MVVTPYYVGMTQPATCACISLDTGPPHSSHSNVGDRKEEGLYPGYAHMHMILHWAGLSRITSPQERRLK